MDTQSILGTTLVLSLAVGLTYMVHLGRKPKPVEADEIPEQPEWEYVLKPSGSITIELGKWAIYYKRGEPAPTLMYDGDRPFIDLNGTDLLTQDGKELSGVQDTVMIVSDKAKAYLVQCIESGKPIHLDGDEYPAINMVEVQRLQLELLNRSKNRFLNAVARDEEARLLAERIKNAI